MTSVKSNNQSLKYQRFTSLGCRYIGIRKFGFVAKTQFLPKIPIGIWEISQMPGYLGNFPYAFLKKKRKCCLIAVSYYPAVNLSRSFCNG